MNIFKKIKSGFTKMSNAVSNKWKSMSRKQKGVTIGVAGTAFVGVITITTLAIIFGLQKEPELPVPPVAEETIEINGVIKDKMEEVLDLEGTGNQEIMNEDTRDTAVQYVISTERDMETGLEHSYATLFVTYNYDTTYGDGEDQEVIKNCSTVAFRYKLTEEQIATINAGINGEDLTKLVEEGFASTPKENIEFIKNPTGRHMDDEDEYTLKEGIKKSLLSRTEEYVGYTENADITILAFHNDDENCEYNIVGVISEGANTEYFKISKGYSTRDELEQIRNEDIMNVCTGQSMEDKGFIVTPKTDASSEVVVVEINGAYYTMAMGSITANKYIVEQADQAVEQTTEPTR